MVYSLTWMNCSRFQQQETPGPGLPHFFSFFRSTFHWHPEKGYNIKSPLPKGKVSERNKLPSWFSTLRVWTVFHDRWKKVVKPFPSIHPQRRDLWLNSLQMVLVQTGLGVGCWAVGGWIFSQQFPDVSRETVLPMGSLSHSMFEKRIRQCGCFRQRYIL